VLKLLVLQAALAEIGQGMGVDIARGQHLTTQPIRGAICGTQGYAAMIGREDRAQLAPGEGPMLRNNDEPIPSSHA
jgi:hypothetical protein